jgi:hypothetical protein
MRFLRVGEEAIGGQQPIALNSRGLYIPYVRNLVLGGSRMAEWFPLSETGGPHKGHGKHLCVAHVMNYIQTNLTDYKDLVRNGKFVCKQCGRVAASADYLCDPDSL